MAQGVDRSISEIMSLVQSIIPYIKNGTSIKKACQTCKIPYTSILEYREKYDDVRILLEEAENYLDCIAESVIADKIINKRDVKVAQWWLERSQKEKYSVFDKVFSVKNDEDSKPMQINLVKYSTSNE
ncbi:MAG: hypothetical protein WCO33_04965 [bacterium]